MRVCNVGTRWRSCVSRGAVDIPPFCGEVESEGGRLSVWGLEKGGNMTGFRGPR